MVNGLVEQTLQEENKEGFKITNLEGATWAFRKLQAIESKKADIKETADRERLRISNWEQSEMNQYESDETYFQTLLADYYKEEREKDSKFKLSTPYGKVSSRKDTIWNWEDEQALMDYLKDNKLPGIRVKEELNKIDIKKQFKNGVNAETGEILPGVSVEQKETITVKAE